MQNFMPLLILKGQCELDQFVEGLTTYGVLDMMSKTHGATLSDISRISAKQHSFFGSIGFHLQPQMSSRACWSLDVHLLKMQHQTSKTEKINAIFLDKCQGILNGQI